MGQTLFPSPSLPSASSLLEPCSDRRTSRDLYIKLFLLHFIIIGAFVHLRRLRGEAKPRLWIYILAVICPLTATLLLILPMLVFMFQALNAWRSEPNISGVKERLRETAAVLFGRIESTHSSDTLPATSLQDQGKNEKFGAETRSGMNRNQRRRFGVLFSFALFAQCATSIWLFDRRVALDVDTLFDHRIFELAILGVAVAVSIFIHEFFRPRPFPSPSVRKQLPTTVGWLDFLDHWRLQNLSSNDGDSEVFGLLAWALTALSLVCLPVFELIHDAPVLQDRSKVLSIAWYCMEMGIKLEAYGFLPVITIFTYYWSRHDTKWPDGSFRLGFVAPAQLMCLFQALCLMTVFGGFFGPSTGLWQLAKLFIPPSRQEPYLNAQFDPKNVSETFPDWSRIWTFDHLPDTWPCSKAWKDPAVKHLGLLV